MGGGRVKAGGGWRLRLRLEEGDGGGRRGKIDENMIIWFDFSRICNMGDTIGIRSRLKFDYLKMVLKEC